MRNCESESVDEQSVACDGMPFVVDSPLWVSGELVAQDRYTVDSSAGLEMLLKFLGCRSIVDLQFTSQH